MNARLCTLLLLLGAACAQPDKSPKPEMRALGQNATSAEETPSDETIGAEVRRQFNLIGPGDTAGIVIHVEDGAVTLTGSAPTRTASWRAEGVAHAVKGVKLVRNEILVTAPASRP